MYGRNFVEKLNAEKFMRSDLILPSGNQMQRLRTQLSMTLHDSKLESKKSLERLASHVNNIF